MTYDQRLTFRRDQVRASRRAADAIDRIYKISGASGIRTDFPNERYWRDLQVGLSHVCNVAENIYAAWGPTTSAARPHPPSTSDLTPQGENHDQVTGLCGSQLPACGGLAPLRHGLPRRRGSPRTVPTAPYACGSTTPPGASRSALPKQDSVAFFGWQVDHEEDLDVVVARLAAAGVAAERGSTELAEARNVDRIITFTDPWGFPHEVIWGQHLYPSTFRPGRARPGFVTGTQGLGHVLLLMPDIEAGHEFFSGRPRLRALSDKIIVPARPELAQFYHVNARHHACAGSVPPGVAGFNHLMLR